MNTLESTPKTISQLLTPEETAAALHVSADTLAVWRSTQRVELKFVRIGRKVLYRVEDVQAFIVERTGTQTSRCDQTWRVKRTASRAKRAVSRAVSTTR
jgi:excisionase family DNA binding protein